MFYDALKEACEKKNTSVSKICDKAGLSRGNISQWKRGRNPRMDTVIEIANSLGVNPAKLISK